MCKIISFYDSYVYTMKILPQTISPNGIFDSTQLCAALKGYANIPMKIKRMVDNGEIVRLKKGLYILSSEYRQTSVNQMIIANLLDGPSYVSADFALSYYGMIPETVKTVTSVSLKRSKLYRTPVGDFLYSRRVANDFAAGIRQIDTEQGGFLIANPEKAIYDKALNDARFDGTDVEAYLFDDLRLEWTGKPNKKVLAALEKSARGKMKNLVSFMRRIGK